MVTMSLNRTLLVTKQKSVRSKLTRKKNPTKKTPQSMKPITEDNLVMPDSDLHGFVQQNGLMIKNVPLHLSDAERQGLVMPVSVMDYNNHKKVHKTKVPLLKNATVSKTQIPLLRNIAAWNRATQIVSLIFSQSSSEPPPQNILEHFQVIIFIVDS